MAKLLVALVLVSVLLLPLMFIGNLNETEEIENSAENTDIAHPVTITGAETINETFSNQEASLSQELKISDSK